ncbi:unnamed protein product [Thlaspi arvense]|uniref:Uncharacterized protein n=1 Tax=Thlaspi arvense TaxID=13288 RepID=A0AAU9T091_THLAR|nr:unnamed protein product [Thlaspi arvense]CAH2077535.1 unnamed protein product [Thlaspi arvense]
MTGIGEEPPPPPPYDDDRKSIDDGDETGIGEESPPCDDDDDRKSIDDGDETGIGEESPPCDDDDDGDETGIGEESPPFDDGRKSMRDPEFALLIKKLRADHQLLEVQESPVDVFDYKTHNGFISDDSKGFELAQKIKRRCCPYDISLCARIGLYCYNFQEGEDYHFGSVKKSYKRWLHSINESVLTWSKSFITLEAVDRYGGRSPLTIETCVTRNDGGATDGVRLRWETCICRVKGSEELADHEWDDKAVKDDYKGEMPRWLSDDDKQRCYVFRVPELVDVDNWWLPLFTELAFYTKWKASVWVGDIALFPPLMLRQVFVETLGEAETETEPRDKLKAPNAIFYLSFECDEDPETGEIGYYKAVVRKTMDGKPGHMRLEVKVLEHLSQENPRKRTREELEAERQPRCTWAEEFNTK